MPRRNRHPGLLPSAIANGYVERWPPHDLTPRGEVYLEDQHTAVWPDDERDQYYGDMGVDGW